MPNDKVKKTSNIQSIERGCKVLDLLAGEKQGYSIREISSQLNLPKPTIHRILKTLSQYGYVMQDENSKEYRLGFRLVELGQAVLSQIDLRKISEPYLYELAEHVQETVHLVVMMITRYYI